MLKSMTGYGRSGARDRTNGEFFVEIQGVNRKYCDININLPKHLLSLEPKIREVIISHITRGRINVFVGQPKGYEPHKLRINTNLVKEYYGILKKIKKELKLKGELDINLMAGVKEFLVFSEPEIEPQKAWTVVEKALKGAVRNFDIMREKEGATISHQINGPLTDIDTRITDIERTVPQIIGNFKKRLEDRLKEAGLTIGNTDERIQKEVAILAEHMDITEELNRMKSHLGQFRSLMKKNEPVGRTMDFLIQEMMREMNTMGAKTVHSDITTYVVYVKSQLEKIREQIQNVE